MPKPAKFDLTTAKARKPEPTTASADAVRTLAVSKYPMPMTASAHATTPKDDAAEVVKHMTVRLNPTAWRTIRQLAVELDTSSHSIILEGLNAMFQKHGKPPVA